MSAHDTEHIRRIYVGGTASPVHSVFHEARGEAFDAWLKGELDAAAREGYEKGYAEGYDAGHTEGLGMGLDA